MAALGGSIMLGAICLGAPAVAGGAGTGRARAAEARVVAEPSTPFTTHTAAVLVRGHRHGSAVHRPAGADSAAGRRAAVDRAGADRLGRTWAGDRFTTLVTDTYAWDERSLRVAALQDALDLPVDGRYGKATLRGHLAALAWVGLPTGHVPAPQGPAPAKWAALRDCESGGDYAIVSSSGRYRGAYQFDQRTWNGVAATHDPHLVGVDPAAASPADQDAMAGALHLERGARPWPHCGRHLS